MPKRFVSALAPACLLLVAACGGQPSRDGSATPTTAAGSAATDARIDPEIAAEVGRIKAIDHHAHPMRLATGDDRDTEYDALPVDAMEPFPLPTRLRPENPEFIGAWKFLYGYQFDDRDEAHVKTLVEAKARAMAEHGDGYPSWVLDRLGIETMVTNRVAMGRGLTAPRFRWVPFADPLMYPLDNTRAKARSADDGLFFESEERLLKRFLTESDLTARPASLDAYLAFVTKTLERHKAQGAIAEKFETAYLRLLDFAIVDRGEAAGIYARRAGVSEAEDKRLQDFLFRHIASECGRLGLAVHIHVALGAGASFRVAAANPLQLDPILNDRGLRQTRFVLVHGGFPMTREAAMLLIKPNVWLDFSAQTFLDSPEHLAGTLREYLTMMPEKVMFGTDAFVIVPPIGWEELAWLSNDTARRALGMALTHMVRAGEVTKPRALDLARMVLRDNARELYGWK